MPRLKLALQRRRKRICDNFLFIALCSSQPQLHTVIILTILRRGPVGSGADIVLAVHEDRGDLDVCRNRKFVRVMMEAGAVTHAIAGNADTFELW